MQIRIARQRVGLVVLQTIEVLVPLAARLAFVWLLLFHPHRAGIWRRCFWVDDGEGAVRIVVKALVIMAMLWLVRTPPTHLVVGQDTYRLVVFKSVLILISLLTSDHGTAKGLGFVVRHHANYSVRNTG